MTAKPGPRRGVTLLEMLAVIVIFSLLLGFTVVFFRGANRDLGVAAAAHHAVALLRVAHQQARSESVPAWVVLDPAQPRISLLVKETVGEWHLEDLNGSDTTGAFARNAKVSGGTSVPGRVGRGLQIGGSGSVNCGAVPVYVPDQGLSIELWFQRRSGRGVIASVGSGVEVAVESDGQVVAKVDSLRGASGALRVPADAWCHLQMVYSGRELRLLLNRREAARVRGRVSWARGDNLVVGGSGFTGLVDEIRLGIVFPSEGYGLPSECSFEFAAGAPSQGEVIVAFDSEGRLDPSMAPQPFEFWIKSPVAWKRIQVMPGGTVQADDRPLPSAKK